MTYTQPEWEKKFGFEPAMTPDKVEEFDFKAVKEYWGLHVGPKSSQHMQEKVLFKIYQTLTQNNQDLMSEVVTEDTSDGYHTFKELYEFRLLYNAHLFNEWSKQGMYDVHKSQRHADGELCFGREDYFIVVATLPTGQISNHYPMSDWDLFQCEATEKAKAVWDGHTSQDVAKRLRQALTEAQTIIYPPIKSDVR